MGLRLIAHYFDRSEALVAAAALDAAGVPGFIENYQLVCNRPFSEIAFGGFRLMVLEEEVEAAVDILREARATPLLEGGTLTVDHRTLSFFALHLAQFFTIGGLILWMPLRRYIWRDEAPPPR